MSKTFSGSLFLLVSAAMYGFYGVMTRFIGGSLGPFSYAWVRSFVTALVLITLFTTKKVKWSRIKKNDIKWFLIWSVPSSFVPVLTFVAFNNLHIGTAYYLLYSTMILGGLISGKIFFSERFNIVKFLSLFLIIAGLFSIYLSDIKLTVNIPVFFMLVAGLIVGFWNTFSKKNFGGLF